MTFEVIAPEDAPAPITQASRLYARMREYEGYVSSNRPGQVGKLVPGPKDSLHGLELRVARASRRIGKPIDVWFADDGAVYFRLAKGVTPLRRSKSD